MAVVLSFPQSDEVTTQHGVAKHSGMPAAVRSNAPPHGTAAAEAEGTLTAQPHNDGSHGSTSTVTVLASGGLGNRLFSVLGGIWLASLLPTATLRVVWVAEPACGAPWQDLFDRPPFRIVATPHEGAADVMCLTPRLIATMDGMDAVNCRETNLAADGEFVQHIRRLLQSGPVQVVYANDRVAKGMSRKALRMLLKTAFLIRPVVSVMSEVAAWGDHGVLVGVHLRGTDAARRANVTQIGRDLATRHGENHIRIFVCSDERSLEEDFVAHMAHLRPAWQVLTRARRYPTRQDAALPFRVAAADGKTRMRSNVVRSTQVTHDALVDLILLSRTSLPKEGHRGEVQSSFVQFARFAQQIQFFEG